MCRLLIYKGQPMLIGDIVIKPENSLVHQSRDAAYHPGVVDKCHLRNITVNADGFGLAWYGDDISKGSCCFKFVTPAWSNQNLRMLGEHISSNLIFAHVRAASSGHDPHEPIIVSQENCHPFTYKQYTFMHNGGIPHFHKIRLMLLNLLSERSFQLIKGTTDTEHVFALFLDCLPPNDSTEEPSNSLEDLQYAINQTFAILQHLCRLFKVEEGISLNLCVSDGVHVAATRYRSCPKTQPPSLYYNLGSNFVAREGHFFALDETIATEIVISSEPLSKVSCVDDACKSASPSYKYGNKINSSSSRCVKVLDEFDSSDPCLCASFNSTKTDCSGENKSNQDKPHGSCCAEEQKDIGSWVLVPRNHMLLCRGDPNNPNVVVSVTLVPISVRTLKCPILKPLYVAQNLCLDGEDCLSGCISDMAARAENSSSLPPKPAHKMRFRCDNSYDT